MYEYKFNLKRVIDGDSIEGDIDLGFDMWLSNVHVRLRGIDAPESRRLSYVSDPELKESLKQYGQLVTNWLNSHLQGTILTIKTQYDSENDKYGRILADLYSRDPHTMFTTHINQFMVDSRLAVEYNGVSPRSFSLENHISNMRHCEHNGFFEVMGSDTN